MKHRLRFDARWGWVVEPAPARRWRSVLDWALCLLFALVLVAAQLLGAGL
jgi:hypothetical protein